MSCKDGSCKTECEGCEEVDIPEDVQKAKMILDEVNESRVKGLKLLDDKVQNLLESDTIDVEHLNNADLVALVREMRSALNGAFQALDGQNKLLDMAINDLINMASKLDATVQNLFVTGSHLQTVSSILTEKGVLTEDEMRATWQKIQMDRLKQQ